MRIKNKGGAKVPIPDNSNQYVVVANGGGFGAEDWVGAGVPSKWLLVNTPNYSIVTGNGFNGNALRLEALVGGTSEGIVTHEQLPFVVGRKYNVSMKFRTNSSVRLFNGGNSFIGGTPANTGNAISYTSNSFTAVNQALCFYLTNIGNYFEIDEINITELPLIAYYPFNGNANDESGNGSNGTLGDGVTPATFPNVSTNRFGESAKAMSFDGVNDYIAIADNNLFSFTNGTNDLPFSMSFWMKFNNNNGYGIFGKANGDNNSPATNLEYVIAKNSENKVGIILYSAANSSNQKTLYSQRILTVGEWYHVIFNYDGTTLNVYINGVFDAGTRTTVGTYTNMINTGSPFEIGCVFRNSTSFFSYFNGKIDDPRIYNRILNELQINALYREGAWQL